MVNTETRLIENAIVWDGVSNYSPPDGYTLVELPTPVEGVATPIIGWSYINGAWVEPPSPPAPKISETQPNVIA